jgi:hypothetical protein
LFEHQRYAHRLMVVLDGLDTSSSFFAVSFLSLIPPALGPRCLVTRFAVADACDAIANVQRGVSAVVGAGALRPACRARGPPGAHLHRRGDLVRRASRASQPRVHLGRLTVLANAVTLPSR